jgi:ATP-dependent Lhr-like helicase
MARRELEPVRIPENSLDVLAQALVGLAVFGTVTVDEAYALVRRSYPYRELPRADFDRVLNYLEGGGRSLEKNYAPVFGKLRLTSEVAPGPLGPATPDSASSPPASIQELNPPLLALPAPRVARDFWQNVGTIASETHIQVRLGRRNLGTIEEGFLKRLRPGDVFVLNGRTVRLIKTTLLTATVAAAESSRPTVPSWNANKMPLASGLAAEVVNLRTALARLLDVAGPTEAIAAAVAWLVRESALTPANATALAAHFALQARVSAIPTADFFLIESFLEKSADRAGRLHYFFHSLIGRSANDALSRIIAQRIQATRGGNALVTIDDYGFLLTLQPFQAIPTAEAWRELFAPAEAEAHLRLALAESELVKWQFRGVAQTGLMVPRRTRGEERGARSLQWSAEIIFDVLRRQEPDHPLLREAYAEATLRFLDTPRALAFLATTPALPFRLIPVERVSPFAFGLYVSGIRETMTLEDPETTVERLFHEMYGTAT